MNGVPEFNRITRIQANPGKRVRFLDLSNNSNVAIGSSYTTSIYAPAGFISRVRNIHLVWNPPAGETSGTKQMYATVAGGAIGAISITDNFNVQLALAYGECKNLTVSPSDKAALLAAMQNIVFDETNGLTLGFVNSTNIITTTNKVIYLWLEDEKIS